MASPNALTVKLRAGVRAIKKAPPTMAGGAGRDSVATLKTIVAASFYCRLSLHVFAIGVYRVMMNAIAELLINEGFGFVLVAGFDKRLTHDRVNVGNTIENRFCRWDWSVFHGEDGMEMKNKSRQ